MNAKLGLSPSAAARDTKMVTAIAELRKLLEMGEGYADADVVAEAARHLAATRVTVSAEPNP